MSFDIKPNYNFSLTRTAVHLYWWNRLYRLFTHLEWYFLCASLVNKSAMHFRKSVTRWISSVGINFQQVYYAFTQPLQLSYNNQFLLNLLGESHAIETLSKRLVPYLDTISDSIHSWCELFNIHRWPIKDAHTSWSFVNSIEKIRFEMLQVLSLSELTWIKLNLFYEFKVSRIWYTLERTRVTKSNINF